MLGAYVDKLQTDTSCPAATLLEPCEVHKRLVSTLRVNHFQVPIGLQGLLPGRMA
jgi:hypothetical protein